MTSYYCPPDTPSSSFGTFTATITDSNGLDKDISTRLSLDGVVYDYSKSLGNSFQVHPSALQSSSEVLTSLISDCESIFPLDRSFWLSHKTPPRCALESLALDIYKYHTRCLPPIKDDDDEKAGMEFWVQIRKDCEKSETRAIKRQRQSPRFSVRDFNPENVNFHWDKDETLIDEGGPTIHPSISTVTYLTSQGAPTIVLPIIAKDGSTCNHLYLSYPTAGKHVAFDGRWLHAAPRSLARDAPSDYYRVTFLVNIWRGYQPIGVDPLPLSAISDLGLQNSTISPKMSFQNRNGSRISTINESIFRKSTSDLVEQSTTSSYKFGASKNGEWLVSISMPPRPIKVEECKDSTIRIEFSTSGKSAGAQLKSII
jgi:hypothetical protein